MIINASEIGKTTLNLNTTEMKKRTLTFHKIVGYFQADLFEKSQVLIKLVLNCSPDNLL